MGVGPIYCDNPGDEGACHQASTSKKGIVHTKLRFNGFYWRFRRGGEGRRGGRRGSRRGSGVEPGRVQAGISASEGKCRVRYTDAGSRTVQGSATGRVGRQAGFGTQEGSQTFRGSATGRVGRQAGFGTQGGSQMFRGSGSQQGFPTEGGHTQQSQSSRTFSHSIFITDHFSPTTSSLWMSVVLLLSSLSSSGNQRQVLALPHLYSIWQLGLHIWASFLCGEKGGRSALWPLGARVPHNVPPPPFHISSALPVPGGRHNIYYIALVTDFIENTFATSSAVFCNLNYFNKTYLWNLWQQFDKQSSLA